MVNLGAKSAPVCRDKKTPCSRVLASRALPKAEAVGEEAILQYWRPISVSRKTENAVAARPHRATLQGINLFIENRGKLRKSQRSLCRADEEGHNFHYGSKKGSFVKQ